MPKNVNKVVRSTESIEGDAVANLELLLPLVKSQPRKDWFSQLDTWKTKYPFSYNKAEPGKPLKPQQVVEELDRQCAPIKDKVIITTGVGQHQMWAAQFYRWRYPRSFVTSGGLGTMGFGVPAAIGAKVACPDKIVIDIDGDASFSMTAMEMQTARQFDIGVKILILNNDFQGMVKQWQDLFYEQRYSGTKMQSGFKKGVTRARPVQFDTFSFSHRPGLCQAGRSHGLQRSPRPHGRGAPAHHERVPRDHRTRDLGSRGGKGRARVPDGSGWTGIE